MDEKRSLLISAGAGSVAALGLGLALYMQSGRIAEQQLEAETLSMKVAQDRSLITGTPDLEGQVILMRETDEVISNILPNDDDVLTFVRALSTFGKDSGVHITQIRDKVAPAAKNKAKEDFRKVGYSINFEADAFQMLSMLDLVESHERFMRVPSFKLTAAPRGRNSDVLEAPLHSIAMEIETFVYEPQSSIKDPARIENYERKADLMAGEVAKRHRELVIPSFDYRGARNRRDPWVDPRVPVLDENGVPPVPIPEQLEIVSGLEERVDRAEDLWAQWDGAANLIAEMKARRDLERHLSELGIDCDRHDEDRVFSYFPAQRRFEQLRERIDGVRAMLDEQDSELPKVELLRGTIETIYAHMEARDYQRAQDAFKNIEGRLPLSLRDPLRRPLAQKIQELGLKLECVLEFQALGLEVTGLVDLGPGRRVVLIDGKAYGPRELLGPDLVVDEIHESHVDFIFKGVRMTLPFEASVAADRQDR